MLLRQINIHDVAHDHGGIRIEFVQGVTVQRTLEDNRLHSAHLPILRAWLTRHDEAFERMIRAYSQDELGLAASAT